VRVWILQTGEPLHCDLGNPRPMRAMNLADALVKRGHQVVLWSSAFYHQEKTHRSLEATVIEVSELLEIRLIPSCGYEANVGLKRLRDHFQLARNLKKLLVGQNPPDVAFIGYPPIETAAVLSRWLKKYKIPNFIDVKDQWPHYFLGAVPSFARPLLRLILFPYFYFGKRALRDASGITSMSQSFVDWAANYRGSSVQDTDVAFALTAPSIPCSFEETTLAGQWWDQQEITHGDVFRLMFVGSFASSFDFMTIAKAAQELLKQGKKVEFVMCGDGDEAEEVRALMSGISNVRVIDWIDRPKIEALALRSAVTIAPYKNIDNFTMNLPNKILDSLFLGKPILTPLLGEVENLVLTNSVGMLYESGNYPTLATCITKLMDTPNLLAEYSANANKLYEDKYTNEKVYGELANFLTKLK